MICLENKQCITCKSYKSISNFSKSKVEKDGLKKYCKKCASEANKRYRDKHKEKVLESNREWYRKSKRNKDNRTAEALVKGQKKCSYCSKMKDITDFYTRGNGGFYGECKSCHNLKVKKYTDKNREEVLNRKRTYNNKNRIRIKNYNHNYYLLNKEDVTKRLREWKEKNPEKYRESVNISNNRRRTLLKELPNTFTRNDWIRCKDFFRNDEGYILCAYCNKKLKRATQDHFIPVSKYGSYSSDNILPVCPSCNSSKYNNDFDEWFQKQDFYSEDIIKKIHEYFQSVK